MLRGGNMWFWPAIFIWLVFTQSFFKFHKNGDIRKLKAWSFRLWKNDFCRLYNERARALQSSITIFLRQPVYRLFLHFVYIIVQQIVTLYTISIRVDVYQHGKCFVFLESIKHKN